MTPIAFTQTGLDKIVAERDKLAAERPDAVSHLTKAREMGDLSENGYYKESRSRLSFIDGRLRYLERIIKNAQVVKPTAGQTVNFGSRVTINNGGKDFIYQVVGGYESDPTKGTISAGSPLGQALMGKKPGEEFTIVTPNGEIKYKVLSINV